MKIEYRTGDLLDAQERYILHGCNAQGVMGSGVAKAIRSRYPRAYEVYRETYLSEGLQLGAAIWVNCGRHFVINGITQEFFGYDGRRYLDYEALRKIMAAIDLQASVTQTSESAANVLGRIDAVAMPMIGAGLAGGAWEDISAIIEAESKHFQPVVYQLGENTDVNSR